MNADQKRRAQAALKKWCRCQPHTTAEDIDGGNEMEALLQELIDEQEMQNLNIVPSKGTRAAIIYRAMLEASPAEPEPDPEIVRDAERYRWLLQQAWIQQAFDRFDLDDGGLQNRFEKCATQLIDAAIAAEKLTSTNPEKISSEKGQP